MKCWAILKKEKNTAFADVYHKMLDENGQPMPDIFLKDNLHMNAKGYAIWQKEIEPYLLKEKQKLWKLSIIYYFLVSFLS